MAKKCVPVGSKEYKMLLKQLGSHEQVAYLWNLNGGKFPTSIRTLTQLKKELNVHNKHSNKSLISLAKHFKDYNIAKGTSHWFVAVQVGESYLYKVELKINYLSKKELAEAKRFFTEHNIPNNINIAEVKEQEKEATKIVTAPRHQFKFSSNEFFVDGEIYPTIDDALNALRENNTIQYQAPIQPNQRYNSNELRGLSLSGTVLNDLIPVISSLRANESLEQDEINTLQEDIAIDFAKEKGIWVEDIDSHLSSLYGTPINEVKQSKSYLDSQRNKVIKSLNSLQYRDLQDFIDSIVLKNTYFPNNPIKVIGLGYTKINGNNVLNIITEQDVIDIEREATYEEIESFVEDLGLYKNPVYNDKYLNDNVLVSELNPGNVIKGKDGNIYILDPIMHLNTPEWGYGGTRSNTTTSTEESITVEDSLITLTDQLKKTGLATKVHQLTTEEINQKLEELGNSNEDVQLTPTGFVHNNDVFINKDTAKLDNPIHEFAHLYNKALKQNNPALYQRGIDLVNQELQKENSTIQSAIDYVRQTQPDLQGEALAEEILAQLTGEQGVKLLSESGAKTQSGILAWLKEAFEYIKNLLGLSQMTNEQAMNLTLEEYSRAVATDLLSVNNLNQPGLQSNNETVNDDVYFQDTNVEIDDVTTSPLGAFDSMNEVIYALTNPDASTFPHELGHLFLNRIVTSTNDRNVQDVKTVIEWYNEQKNTNYPTDWNSLSNKQKRDIHEAFANGFVVYLYEKREYEDSSVTSIFDKFAKWLKKVIDSVKEALGIELNEPVREVYDRLLGLEKAKQPTTDIEDIGTVNVDSNEEVEVTETEEINDVINQQDIQEEQTVLEDSTNEEIEVVNIEEPIVESTTTYSIGEINEEGTFPIIVDNVEIGYVIQDSKNKWVNADLPAKQATKYDTIEEVANSIYNNYLNNKPVEKEHYSTTDSNYYHRTLQKDGNTTIYEIYYNDELIGSYYIERRGDKGIITEVEHYEDSNKGTLEDIFKYATSQIVNEGLTPEISKTLTNKQYDALNNLSLTGYITNNGIPKLDENSKATRKHDYKNSVPFSYRSIITETSDVIVDNEIYQGDTNTSVLTRSDITTKVNKDGTVNLVIIKTGELLKDEDGNVYFLTKDEDTGDWYINNSNIEDTFEEHVEYILENYNDQFFSYSQDVKVYEKITVYDKDNNPIEISVLFLDETSQKGIVSIDKSGNAVYGDVKSYVYKDVHGNKYILGKRGVKTTVEEYENQPVVESPLPKYNIGDKVYYNGKEGIITNFEVGRDFKGYFITQYIINDKTVVNESSIDSVGSANYAEQYVAETKKEKELYNAIMNIAGQFNNMFAENIKIVIGNFTFNGFARFNKGVVEVNMSKIIGNDKPLNIAEIVGHEFLHPFIKALYISNRTLFDSLVGELQDSGIYDSINNEIDEEIAQYGEDSAYISKDENDIKEEILTRYLSREIAKAFNERGIVKPEYIANQSKSILSDLFNTFIKWLESIVKILTGQKGYFKFNSFVENLNKSDNTVNGLKTFLQGKNGLFARYDSLKNIIKNADRYKYNVIIRRFNATKEIESVDGTKFTTYPLRDELEKLLSPEEYSTLERIITGSVNKFIFDFSEPIGGNLISITKNNNGIYTIQVNPSIQTYGSGVNFILKQAIANSGVLEANDINEVNDVIDNAFYRNVQGEDSQNVLKVGEINPLMSLNDMTTFLLFQVGKEEMRTEGLRIGKKMLNSPTQVTSQDVENKTIYDKIGVSYNTFKIAFTAKEQSAISELEAYMAMSDKQLKTTRSIIVDRIEKLSKIAKNYKSDDLKYAAASIKALNDEALSDKEFIEQYAQEANVALGRAYRKFFELRASIKENTGKIGRNELNAYNKEFIVIRQLLSFHDQFNNIITSSYSDTLSSPTDTIAKLFKTLAYVDVVKQAMEDMTVDLTVEWLLPYAEQHNEYMAKQGYTEEEYQITAKDLRNHFKYGVGEDTGYISYWLGSNVTSRNVINALVANTINQDLMKTNIYIQDSSMDISVAYNDFLKDKGFGNLTAKSAINYYKNNYLRKAKVLQRIYDKTTNEYKDEYVDKWALHQEFYWDLYEKDLNIFISSLPLAKTQEQEDANQDAIIEWKQKQGFSINSKGIPSLKNSKYINKDYQKIKNEPLFKVLEKKYNIANEKYGFNKLRYGIIPQKYNSDALTQFRNAIKSVKSSEKTKEKFELIRDQIAESFQYSNIDSYDYNMDGTAFRRLNTTLTTIKNEENLDLSLHEVITDFIGESYRYEALQETRYNAETLITLLEGNSAFNINARAVKQDNVSLFISNRNSYIKAKSELKSLLKAKDEGVSVDQSRIDKLQKIVDDYDENKVSPLRDNVMGRVLQSRDPRANKMLIAQLNDIYFGESVDDWNIKFLKNASAAKLAHHLSIYESVIRMGGNLIAASNNLLMGNVQMFIEAHGGRYYSKKTLLKATAKYSANIHKYLMDIKNPIKSKEAQLAIQLDAIQGEIQDEFGKRVSGSLASKFFRTGSLFFLTAAGEHQIQLTNMIAMLMAKKVTTKSGEVISLYDAYVADSNGRYHLRKDLKDFNQNDLLKFMRDLQGVNRQLNGNYSDFNKTMLQRKWYGNLILKFRKWMYPSFRARWGGYRIDYERNTPEIGYFRFFLKYLKDGVTGLIKNENNFKIKDLKPHEKYALRKAIMEIGIYLAITILALTMFGGDDDPKDLSTAEKYLLLSLIRLHSDLEIYNGGIPNIVTAIIPGVPTNMPNPTKDWIKIFRSPSASVNTLVQFTKIIESLEDPYATYKQSGPGYKRGENKLWINTRKLLPFRQFLDLAENRFEGTIDGQLGYYEMINKGIKGVKAQKSTLK